MRHIMVTVTIEPTDLWGCRWEMVLPFQAQPDHLDTFYFNTRREAKTQVERMLGRDWRPIGDGFYQAEIPVQR